MEKGEGWLIYVMHWAVPTVLQLLAILDGAVAIAAYGACGWDAFYPLHVEIGKNHDGVLKFLKNLSK